MNKKVVIVGGGAGGLELATRLGRRHGRKGLEVTLVDRNQTHLWKPLLHEVATGSLDAGIDELSYRAQASNNHFQFRTGTLQGLDRERRQVYLAPVTDAEGNEILPRRALDYDLLVLSIGSVTNDFGTPGAAEHCVFLDSRHQAEHFRQQLLQAYLRSSSSPTPLRIAIVGAGATGVELSAELFNTARELTSYGFENADIHPLEVSLIEAGPRILPALPERIAGAARHELEQLGVSVRSATRIREVTAEGLITAEDELIEADLMVWAAGIKAPPVTRELDGLEINGRNQLVVTPSLRTTLDANIFALGDCAACPMADGGNVPPRAQSAHQMASHLYKHIRAMLDGQEIPAYEYRDHGSLVSLSRFSTVGSLMGNLTRGSMMIEGRLARLVYISLYRMHQMALYGVTKTVLVTLVDRINRVIRPRLKLH
ncbi:NADH dehydrogenase [Marinobacterium nitratireducens]|uniref:NADH dehydrogenase n=1 Tax=Marinobacterium nitratireducens TaxID=518897 RepID=A0A917ZDA2_9GAMM|nr:NAD(P)/FAD-dependent oxidoreductase [Marinobacterium nitratireducens]GGO81215.1 NADH dehydrogenase [Marinobacterium nitratireducens]